MGVIGYVVDKFFMRDSHKLRHQPLFLRLLGDDFDGLVGFHPIPHDDCPQILLARQRVAEGVEFVLQLEDGLVEVPDPVIPPAGIVFEFVDDTVVGVGN